MSYHQILYQIVFSTKDRRPTLVEKHCEHLYRYIYGIIKSKNCHLYRINGVEDHVHIFTGLHPTIPLAGFIKDIKIASNQWIKESGLFPNFDGWQNGYGAFTYSIRDKEKIINYVKNQKEHHEKESFIEEFKRLLIESKIEFDEKYIL